MLPALSPKLGLSADAPRVSPSYKDRLRLRVLSAIALFAMLLFVNSCARPPADTSAKNSPDAESLPFDRQPRSSGVSPSQSILPSTTTLPEGTPIYVRLNSSVSSASSHSGDVFNAIVDAPIAAAGETLIDKGSAATGRVLEAMPATSRLGPHGGEPLPGYLRIELVSLSNRGQTVSIETSSIFAKGMIRQQSQADESKPAPARGTRVNGEVEFGPDRRLGFRLAQTLELSVSVRPPRSAAR
jgi:hypothetical protein